jgi:hypothetical protein
MLCQSEAPSTAYKFYVSIYLKKTDQPQLQIAKVKKQHQCNERICLFCFSVRTVLAKRHLHLNLQQRLKLNKIS